MKLNILSQFVSRDNSYVITIYDHNMKCIKYVNNTQKWWYRNTYLGEMNEDTATLYVRINEKLKAFL